MSNHLKTRKPSYLFAFPDDENAKKFYDYALSQENSTIVQHPLNPDGSGSRDLKRVLVTGTGSVIFDAVLYDRLVDTAKEFRGHYMSKVD